MTEFDKTNRGAIFVNDKKQEGSKQPDRTGSLNVDGVEYFLDGWLKKSNSGQSFMSLSVKRKDKQPQAAQRPFCRAKLAIGMRRNHGIGARQAGQ